MMILKRKMFIVLFLLPSILLFLIFFAIPIIEIFVTSFCKWTLGQHLKFSGLHNYKELFIHNPNFGAAFLHTMLWIVINVSIGVPFAILVALVLSKKPFGWKFTRNAFVLPNIISTSAIAMLFMNMLDSDYGVVNAIIRVFVKDFHVSWLQDERTAFLTVTLSWVLFAGTNVLLLMAEIASVSDSMIEAAKIDGANSLKIDLFIILPMIRNIVGTITILSASSAITSFGEVYILTKGGPGTATLNLGVYLFNSSMSENNYGLANTVGVIQMIIGLFVILIITKVFKIGKSYV
jgi:raffinose/stachyose/melibiose transport system permease protein